MGWSGRAPALPAREAGKGRRRQGARHVGQAQLWNQPTMTVAKLIIEFAKEGERDPDRLGDLVVKTLRPQ
jgi:hypothetical protein